MTLLRVAAALVLLVQAGFLALLAYLGKAMEGWTADPTDQHDGAVIWLALLALATVVALVVGLTPVRRGRLRALALAVLAVVAAADAVLVAMAYRWGWSDGLLVVCPLGILACLALMYTHVVGAKGSAVRRRTSVG